MYRGHKSIGYGNKMQYPYLRYGYEFLTQDTEVCGRVLIYRTRSIGYGYEFLTELAESGRVSMLYRTHKGIR